jgi:Na+-translocating ferredoxin:NAD+ oxidoreductase RnfA subunit
MAEVRLLGCGFIIITVVVVICVRACVRERERDTKLFKYGDGVTFLGYVGTNTELLSVEFCNFMHSHNFTDFLTVE